MVADYFAIAPGQNDTTVRVELRLVVAVTVLRELPSQQRGESPGVIEPLGVAAVALPLRFTQRLHKPMEIVFRKGREVERRDPLCEEVELILFTIEVL